MMLCRIALVLPFLVIGVSAIAEDSNPSQAAIQHLEQASERAKSGNVEGAVQESEWAKQHVIQHEVKHPFHVSSKNPKELARKGHTKQALETIDQAKTSAQQGRSNDVVNAAGEAQRHIQEETDADKAPN